MDELVYVPIPADREGRQVACRVPALPVLAALGVLPMPLFGAVVEEHKHDSAEQAQWVIPTAEEVSNRSLDVLNRFVIAAMVSPCAVLTRDEDGPAAVCVDDLGLPLKEAIFRAALPSVPAVAGLSAFVTESESAIMFDVMAQRYGLRPSQLLAIDHPMLAIDVDAAIAMRGIYAEAAARRRPETFGAAGGGASDT